MIAGARAIGCELVMPHKGCSRDELRDRAREAGIKVATWVVDEPEELRALARFDLYGIGSNRPRRLLDSTRAARAETDPGQASGSRREPASVFEARDVVYSPLLRRGEAPLQDYELAGR